MNILGMGKIEKGSAMAKKPNYGVDRPDLILALVSLGLISIAIGVFKLVPGSSWLGYFGIILVASSGVFVFGSRWKPAAARQLLNTLDWTGSEAVLDVGCGRGLWLVEAAKHLTTGRAVGIDIWNKRLQSGNSPERALENAQVAGVADRVEVKYGDARKIPFTDDTFDIVISSLVIHHVPAKERKGALLEIVRVLKPGGRLALLEIFGEVARYSKVLRDAGISDVKMSWVRGGMVFGVRTLVGTKARTRTDPSSRPR